MPATLPPQTETGAGFEPVTVTQFTTFLENRVGRMVALMQTVEGRLGRINAFSVEECADAALVRLICPDSERTRQALREGKFSFSETPVLCVELPPHQPLLSVSAALLAAEINVHSAYPLLHRPAGPAIAIYVDDNLFAAKLLIRKNYRILGETDLQKR